MVTRNVKVTDKCLVLRTNLNSDGFTKRLRSRLV